MPYSLPGRNGFARVFNDRTVLTAYDTRGLVAFTRDGHLASTGSMRFYLYDELCRPVVSGLCRDFLSDSQWLQEHDTPVVVRPAAQGGSAPDYNLGSLNMPEGAVVTDMNYYDSYLPENVKPQWLSAPSGLMTATRSSVVRYEAVEHSVLTAYHYNERGQVALTEEKRDDGTRVLTSEALTRGGLPLQRHTSVTTSSGGHSLTEYIKYDPFSRVTSVRAQGPKGGVRLIARNSYDNAGRLASTESEGGFTTSFRYDARGVLTGSSHPLVSLDYYYASGPGAPSYAGRISAKTVTFKDGAAFHARKHKYSYDRFGRLAESSLRDGGSFMPVPGDRPSLGSALSLDSAVALPTKPFGPRLPFPADNSETFTYDLNANIVGITRKGAVNGLKYDTIDDIEMEYLGNRLTTLRDKADDVFMESSMDVPSGSYGGRDFGYNAAGCVTRDVSRGIAHMTYHASGLPDMIGSMTSDYTTAGVKLCETVWNGSRITRRGYAGPVETVDGRVVRVNVAQGYFDSLGVLHAYIPDIQGNIVGVYEAKEGVTELEQLNEYYAYGGITADSRGQDRNRRKYTAKELITDLGINTYDFSARRQYPALGRFDAPDKLAGTTPWNSPYAFCSGDPINRSDPSGLNDFYDHEGNMIGSDDINNGIIWIIPKKSNNTIDEIKKIDKKPSEKWNEIRQKCVSTDATINMLKEMMGNIEDDGNGGTSDNNNKEYGGTYENGTVSELPSGKKINPSKEDMATIDLPDDKRTYHSHPSGTSGEEKTHNNIILGSWNAQTIENKPAMFGQRPSRKDKKNAKKSSAPIHLVFAMKDKRIYVYNSNTIGYIPFEVLNNNVLNNNK